MSQNVSFIAGELEPGCSVNSCVKDSKLLPHVTEVTVVVWSCALCLLVLKKTAAVLGAMSFFSAAHHLAHIKMKGL